MNPEIKEYMKELYLKMRAEQDSNNPDVPDLHLISWYDYHDSEIWKEIIEENETQN